MTRRLVVTVYAYGLHATEPTTWRRRLHRPPYGPGWRIYRPTPVRSTNAA